MDCDILGCSSTLRGGDAWAFIVFKAQLLANPETHCLSNKLASIACIYVKDIFLTQALNPANKKKNNRMKLPAAEPASRITQNEDIERNKMKNQSKTRVETVMVWYQHHHSGHFPPFRQSQCTVVPP